MGRAARLVAIVATVAGLLAPLTPSPAEARGVTAYKSRITVDDQRRGDLPWVVVFVGSVHSRKAACERNRRVRLVQLDLDFLAGEDRTGRRGRWRIEFNGSLVPVGTMEAIARRRIIHRDNNTIVCRRDRTTYEIQAPVDP